MRQTGTRLTDAMFEQLQTEANQSGTNVSDLMRSIIAAHYDKVADKQEKEAIHSALKLLVEQQKLLVQQAHYQQSFRAEVRKALNIAQAQSGQPSTSVSTNGGGR